MSSKNLSAEAQALFIDLFDDACNWSGSPLFGGNVGGDAQSKGYLTKLKKAGLLTTEVDDEDRTCSWVYFTPEGIEYAKSLGLEAWWTDRFAESETQDTEAAA